MSKSFKLVLLLILACLLAYPAKNKKEKEAEQPTEAAPPAEEIIDGPVEKKHPNGNIKEKGIMAGGKKNGKWEFYLESGSLQYIFNYIDNKRSGEAFGYYPSGKLNKKGVFENEKKSGEWFEYFENGQIKTSETFTAGVQNGRYTEYSETGAKKTEGMIENGLKTGIWSNYGPDKTLIEKLSYVTNQLAGTCFYYSSNRILRECEYVNGAQNGTEINYFPDGETSSRGIYTGGQKSGKWIFYSKDKTVSKEGEFKFNRQEGEWKEYYPGGKVLAAKGAYQAGKKSGLWDHFDKEGKLIMQLTWMGMTIRGNCIFYKNDKKDYEVIVKGAMDVSEINESVYDGKYIKYNTDCKEELIGNYKMGNKHGKWTYFRPDGSIEKEENWMLGDLK